MKPIEKMESDETAAKSASSQGKRGPLVPPLVSLCLALIKQVMIKTIIIERRKFSSGKLLIKCPKPACRYRMLF